MTLNCKFQNQATIIYIYIYRDTHTHTYLKKKTVTKNIDPPGKYFGIIFSQGHYICGTNLIERFDLGTHVGPCGNPETNLIPKHAIPANLSATVQDK